MKCFLFILLPFVTNSQEPADSIFPLKDGKIHYEKIFTIDSASKDQLFTKMKTWATTAFVSQKDVLQSEDKEAGILIYKSFIAETMVFPSVMGVKSTTDWQYWYLLQFFFKDGKMKVVIDNIELRDRTYGTTYSIFTYRKDTEGNYKKGMAGKGYRDRIYASVRSNFKETNDDLNAFMTIIERSAKVKAENDF